MKLVVGLGNPGRLYSGTRHNIGSLIVTRVCREQGLALKKERGIPAATVAGEIGGAPALFAVPLTYMNLSGLAVGPLRSRHRTPPEDLLVVYDDLDLDPGRLKFKPGGSAAGHNGVRSVIAALGSQEFPRLRVGIGRPDSPEADIARYVLRPFARQEKGLMEETVEKACIGVRVWITEGITASMNMFNR